MASKSLRKPAWLRVRFPAGPNFARIDRLHREEGLNSVCRSAACPNQGECWSQGTATFMILGDRCTRDCRFCNVVHASPATPDPLEPQRVAEAVAELSNLASQLATLAGRDCVFRSRKARAELGWIPAVGLHQGLAETARWLRGPGRVHWQDPHGDDP